MPAAVADVTTGAATHAELATVQPELLTNEYGAALQEVFGTMHSVKLNLPILWLASKT